MGRSGGSFWLYLRLGVLNLAVAGTFYSISQTVPPPTVFYAPIPVRHIAKQQIKTIRSGIPTQIVIPSLGLDLVVDTGSYDVESGEWGIDTTKAFYADVSVPPNDNNGTTLIYGHARWPVFGNLYNLQPESKVTINTDTGYSFNYVYQSMRQVLPTDTSIFKEGGDPVLVLQTCSGAWDTYRSLFTFKLKSVGKV